MASSVALRRATASSLLSKLVNPIRSASVAPSRFFNTNAQVTTLGGDDDRGVDVERRPYRSVSRRGDPADPAFVTDVLDPFGPTRSLTQMLNLMDQFLDPFTAASRGLGAGAARRGWDVREEEDALYLRMDMPGVEKEKVKIVVEHNTLIVKGEGEKEDEEDEYVRRYSSRIDLPRNLYKLDEVKAEMKNGVLKVKVPKVKEEERPDVHVVKIE